MNRRSATLGAILFLAAFLAYFNILTSELIVSHRGPHEQWIEGFLKDFKGVDIGGSQRNQQNVPLNIRYVGVAGLGHRLIRMSCAYHLAKVLKIPSFDVFWKGNCPRRYRSKPNILQLLFGDEALSIPRLDEKTLFPFLEHETSASLTDFLFGPTEGKNSTKIQQLKLVNDVQGYSHMYESHDFKGLNPPFFGKTVTDYEFYSQLIQKFQFREEVDNIMASYSTTHTVIGIHIRAGNGEVGDFEKFRQLGYGNINGWLHNFTSLLQNFLLLNQSLVSKDKPPMIFLATDTASVIDNFKGYMGETPVLVVPQHYPSTGEGVSYNGNHANLSMCLDSWKYQMMDMTILSEYTDILIAGQYSSFTQSLPLSRLLNDQTRQRLFCDVDKSALALKCYDSVHGISSFLNDSDHSRATFVGKVTEMDKTTFAGPQIFFPVELTDQILREMILGMAKKKHKPRK